jgi:hypothetical protein
MTTNSKEDAYNAKAFVNFMAGVSPAIHEPYVKTTFVALFFGNSCSPLAAMLLTTATCLQQFSNKTATIQ